MFVCFFFTPASGVFILFEIKSVMGDRFNLLEFLKRMTWQTDGVLLVMSHYSGGSSAVGWFYRLGHRVQSTECLLALLTSIQAYRKPTGTKDLQCFHWLSPYLNTLHHSHTPRTHS